MKQEKLPPSTTAAGLILTLLLITLCYQPSGWAQTSTFTYHGRLSDNGTAANGIYDLIFTLYDSTNSPGSLVGAPLTNSAVAVSNGLFIIALNYGASAFSGADRWLEIAVRTNGSAAAYAVLSPRQQITSTPYAIRAANFGGAVSDAQLSANIARLNANQTFSGTVSLIGLSNSYAGSFTGNGAGVTNLNLAANSGGSLSFGNFVINSSLIHTSAPSRLIATDVNNDGRVDIVGLNGDGTSLIIFTNNGAAGFLASSAPGAGNGPNSLVAADVNGDGNIDLISTHLFLNSLSVLTNNGRGGFVLASSPTIGTRSVSLAAADVNGDGRLDLISANISSNTLTVLTNSGSGGFVASSSPVVSNNPALVTAVDLNGDGSADLISINASSLTALTNDGRGGFFFSSSLPLTNAGAVVTADINGDGRVDLVTIESFGGVLKALTNNGAGGLAVSSTTPADSCSSQYLTAADINGDGRMDIILGNACAAHLQVFTNNGAAGFGLAASPNLPAAVHAVVAADANGDGRVDLVTSNPGLGTNTLTVLLNVLTVAGGLDVRGGLDVGGVLSVDRTLSAGGDLDVAGRVGIGTTNPHAPLEILGDWDGQHGALELTGNLPTIRFNPSGSTQPWVLQAAPSGITFYRDIADSLYHTLDLNNNGYVGIGYASPQAALHVRAPEGAQLRLQDTTYERYWNLYTESFNSTGNLLFINDIGVYGYIRHSDAVYFGGSDARLKRDITPLEGVLPRVLQLRPVSYHFRNATAEAPPTLGLIAQEVEPLFPEVVDEHAGMKALAYSELVPVAIRAIQELNQKLEQQLKQKDARMQELEKQNADLQQRVERLERLSFPKNGTVP